MPFRSPKRREAFTSVALRYPSNKAANALILAGGGFIAAPSANTSGRPEPTKAEHVIEDLGDKIDCIIDGGDAEIGLESTIVDFTEGDSDDSPPGLLQQRDAGKSAWNRACRSGNPCGGTASASEGTGHALQTLCAEGRPFTIIQGEMERVIPEINRLAAEQEKVGKKVGVICT